MILSVSCRRGAIFQNCGSHVWVDFLTILGGFGLVWGRILGAKGRPQLLQNLIKKMIDFWIAPKTVLGGLWDSKRGPWGEGPKCAKSRGWALVFRYSISDDISG